MPVYFCGRVIVCTTKHKPMAVNNQSGVCGFQESMEMRMNCVIGKDFCICLENKKKTIER